nr:hypothetical protein [Saccharopolyspora sp. ASAGF58]
MRRPRSSRGASPPSCAPWLGPQLWLSFAITSLAFGSVVVTFGYLAPVPGYGPATVGGVAGTLAAVLPIAVVARR